MKYGFIGCGNMGGAIASALSRVCTDIMVTDRSGKAKSLAERCGIRYGSTEAVAAECGRIFLAVKPHLIDEALAPVLEILRERKPLLITMAAGVEIRALEQKLGARLPIIRIMPNTPVAVGKGLTQYCCSDLVDADTLQDFLDDMACTGIMDPLEERLIDAACALSGCGPAYMYMFIEALADGAVACGLPRDKAVRYAAATMAGSAEMVLATGTHPGALKDAVCSPGGSTIQGVRALESRGLRSAAFEAVSAAYEKSTKLGK